MPFGKDREIAGSAFCLNTLIFASMKKTSGRLVAFIIALLIVGGLWYFFSNIILYVIISWVFSLMGKPVYRFYIRRLKFWRFQIGPSLASALTILTFLLGFGFLLRLFIPLFVQQAANLSALNYSAIAHALDEPLAQLNDWMLKHDLVSSPLSSEEQLQQALRLEEWFKPEQLSNWFAGLLAAAGNIFIAFFSVIFITFFFLRDQGLFTKVVQALVPDMYEQKVEEAIETISELLTRYFIGVLSQITIITVFVTLGLSFLGVENALLIGFFAALINVIPYLGPAIGAVVGILITISSNLDLDFYEQMLPLIGKVALVFALMQMLDNFVLQPWIFSNSVRAHPLEIFLVIMMGAKLGGIFGMVVAIPTYTVLRVIAATFLSQFKFVQELTERMEEKQ